VPVIVPMYGICEPLYVVGRTAGSGSEPPGQIR